MTDKDFKANSIALFIVIISIILLITCVIFSQNTKFSDSELADIELNAKDLVTANFDCADYFRIASLYSLDGYSADDYPEGTAPCSTEIFKNYNELSDFVQKTYVPTEAAILLNGEINGIKRYFDYKGQLCKTIIEPDTTYKKDWSKVKIKLSDIKKKSADITVIMNIKDSTDTATIKLSMVKQSGKWLLNNLEY